MVVGAGGQNAGLLQSHAPRQGHVLLVGPDPARDLGVRIPQGHDLLDGLFVLARVEEELRVAYHAPGSRESVEFIEHLARLPQGKWRPCLLAVTEGGIGDKHLLGWRGREQPVIEPDPGCCRVGEEFAHQVRLGRILESK